MFLQLNGLKKMYDADNGLRHLDLSMQEGDFVTLLGPSGCGKTTALNLIGGFLKADSGSIILEGKDITRLPPEQRPVSTVFQSYALFPHLDVLSNIAYGLRFQGGQPKRRAREQAREHLNTVGLADYANARVGNLSGGQQQRVALARAMAISPKILLLDEPLSNLDAALRLSMRNELKELQKKLGITMIFVTHDQAEALCLSDRIVVMERGVAAQIGSPRDIYLHPQTRYVSAFVGKSNYVEHEGKSVIVRPEDIQMVSDAKGAYEIIEAVFMGSYTEYYLRGEHGHIEVDLSGTAGGGFSVGQRVSVTLLHTIELY